MHADGVFYQMPFSSEKAKLNPLEVTLFNTSYNKDKFSNTAWTLNGKFGPLHAVYTGGYLVRNVDQVQDYTNYARGVYADYYQCYGPGSGTYSAAGGYAIYGAGDLSLTSKCASPSATWREQERNTHQTHEFRISAPDDWRVRFIAGGFYEDLRIEDQTDWFYKSLSNCTGTPAPNGVYLGTGCMGNVAPVPGSTVNNPNTRNDNEGFGEDIKRGYKQTAFFGSMDFDIIPKVLTVTAGTRHFDYKLDQKGTVMTSFGCFEAPAPCYPYSYSEDAKNLNVSYKGWKSRGNLTWHITPDMMAYYTWSQGYRPGGFNRRSKSFLAGEDGVKQFIEPLTFAPDSLTNNEVGFKSEFLHHRLQINGSIYKEEWKSVQTGLFNPGVLGNLTLATNGADYEVKGLELQVTARVTEALTLMASGSYNDAKQVNSPFLIDNNPASANYGNPITTYFSGGVQHNIQNTFGNAGTPTAYSPKVQLNARARYDWTISEYAAFAQIGIMHVGEMYNNTATDPNLNGDDPTKAANINTTLFRFRQDAYTTFDASFGFAKDAWSVQFFGQNLGNSNASTFTSTAQFIKTEVPLRPRVLGMRVGMKF
jgi:outer membrane receptor protein involved in Fe transport